MGVSRFAVLPQVNPPATMVAVLLALLPCLAATWMRPRPASFAAAVAYSNLCGFMFGWHVHEKAALMATVPLALAAVRDGTAGAQYLVLSTAAHVGLFPLLFQPAEVPIRWLLALLYALLAWHGLAGLHAPHAGGSGSDGKATEAEAAGGAGASSSEAWLDAGYEKQRITRAQARRMSGAGGPSSGGGAPAATPVATRPQPPLPRAAPWLPAPMRAYLWGFVPLELYCVVGHGALHGDRLPFLPLMLTSVYCALGVSWAWAGMAAGYVRELLPQQRLAAGDDDPGGAPGRQKAL